MWTFSDILNKLRMCFQSIDENVFNALGHVKTVYQKYFIGKNFEINNLLIILIFSDYIELK